MALIGLALVGCGSGTITTSTGAVVPAATVEAQDAVADALSGLSGVQAKKAQRLQAWHGAVAEAKDALARGGACPLQVERLQRLAKEYPR